MSSSEVSSEVSSASSAFCSGPRIISSAFETSSSTGSVALVISCTTNLRQFYFMMIPLLTGLINDFYSWFHANWTGQERGYAVAVQNQNNVTM